MTALIASDPLPTVLGMVNPWRRFAALGDEWRLRWHHPDEDSRRGFINYVRKEISLRSDLTWAEQRCTLLHEVIHAERGAAGGGVLYEREELRVRRIAAHLLLPEIKVIGEAMAWALSTAEAADELMVDIDSLRDRLRWLHPAELHYLRHRLEGID